jgi:hypothetical protein
MSWVRSVTHVAGTNIGSVVARERVGHNSRQPTLAANSRQAIVYPAIIELGAWRQSMVGALARFHAN